MGGFKKPTYRPAWDYHSRRLSVLGESICTPPSPQSGLIEMKTHLDHLEKEKERLETEISDMQTYCDSLVGEGAVGQVLKQFDGMEVFLKGAYAKVLVGHAAGIQMLKTEFGYHPAYKRGREGEFSASYFTPCRNPNNPNKK